MPVSDHRLAQDRANSSLVIADFQDMGKSAHAVKRRSARVSRQHAQAEIRQAEVDMAEAARLVREAEAEDCEDYFLWIESLGDEEYYAWRDGKLPYYSAFPG